MSVELWGKDFQVVDSSNVFRVLQPDWSLQERVIQEKNFEAGVLLRSYTYICPVTPKFP